ncbi:hypothetical protein ACLOAV_001433 [Pseudogymnoascus australis]
MHAMDNKTLPLPAQSSIRSFFKPKSPSYASAPSAASISPILPSHITALKRINALLLCITYPDSFYTRILAPSPPPPSLEPSSVCHLEPSPSAPGQQQLYIQSLALLSPYRHLGLASAALASILTAIVSSPLEEPITSLYAHVWTENAEGLEWYKARGFEVEGGVVGVL